MNTIEVTSAKNTETFRDENSLVEELAKIFPHGSDKTHGDEILISGETGTADKPHQ